MEYVMLNKQSYIPLYQQMIDELKKRIEAGEYKPGQVLPSETSFCEEFGVSRITVRQAVQILTDEGVVVKRHGKGSFVSEKYGHTSSRFIRFLEVCKEQGLSVYSHVLSVAETAATRDLIGTLELAYGESVIQVISMLYANYKPMVMVHGYYPADTFGFLTEADLENQDVHDLILKHTGIDTDIQCIYKDRLSTAPANAEEAEHLAVSKGDPVFILNETLCLPNGKPFFALRETLSGKHFSFELSGKGAKPVISLD